MTWDSADRPGETVRHLLVTNDFPPKIGGIQSYLWELWRRLPPESFSVITSTWPGSEDFDRAQPFKIRRLAKMLLPTPQVASYVREIAKAEGAQLVVMDPAFPLGIIGPGLGLAYAVVLHGAEVSVPGRLPATRAALRRTIAGAALGVVGGGWVENEVRRLCGTKSPPMVQVPPGVDPAHFRPLSQGEIAKGREKFGLRTGERAVVAMSRLVPRKGIDVLIKAVAEVAQHRQGVTLLVGGRGRDHRRLGRIAKATAAPVRFLGPVAPGDLRYLYGVGEVFAMPCRTRWAGLEQEGYGIVFLEAGACGVPQIAGDSGGAAEAVLDGITGKVVAHPEKASSVAAALGQLLDDPALRMRLGSAAMQRARSDASYDRLAERLSWALSATAEANKTT